METDTSPLPESVHDALHYQYPAPIVKRVELKEYQSKFLTSPYRFPLLKAGIGTGKTLMLLLKAFQHCERNPNALALIVRKEYTDLRDSTIKDFERYFGGRLDVNKEYHFANGAVLMFRHGAEINVLKNMNLSFIGIEQGEEFDNEEVFIYLRDRLRRDNVDMRQLCIIANANGHNWLWRMWKSQVKSTEYHIIEATTFDNASNLPPDFIEDVRSMELESPSHYRRMVMNSDEEDDVSDALVGISAVEKCRYFILNRSNIKKVIAIDVAGDGNEDDSDETVIYAFRNEQVIDSRIFRGKDTMNTVGEALIMSKNHDIDLFAVDAVGIGKGVSDRLTELGKNVISIVSGEVSGLPKEFGNLKAEIWWYAKKLIESRECLIPDDDMLVADLCGMRYHIRSDKIIELYKSKDIRKLLGRSPDRGTAFVFGLWALQFAEDEIYRKQRETDHYRRKPVASSFMSA